MKKVGKESIEMEQSCWLFFLNISKSKYFPDLKRGPGPRIVQTPD